MKQIKNENYITIQGFMINDLNLKGNELLVYAIIYGFTQLENQEFKGSLQYLADWCNSTKQGILKALKSLIDKKLIKKQETIFNNVKFVSYCSTKLNGVKQSLTGGETEFNGGVQQSLPNNIKDNKEDKDNIKENIKEIVDYLNKRTKKNYQPKGATYDFIKARLDDGYTVEDCKHVIDVKYEQWYYTEMEKYLRPETLFNRTKFESYVNEEKVCKDDYGGFEVL